MLNDFSTTRLQRVPVARFSSCDYTHSDAFDAYQALYSGGSDVTPIGSGFAARLEASTLGSIVVFERWLNGVIHERSSSRIRTDDFEHFVLQLNLSGSFLVRTPERSTSVAPGQIILLDAARPYRNHCEDVHLLTVSVVREVVEKACGGNRDLHGLVLPLSEGALLADYLISLRRHMPQLSAPSAPSLATVLTQLLTVALMPGQEPASQHDIDMPKLAAAKRIIEQHLHSTTLAPNDLAAQIGVSRSRLYQLFRPLGGVSAYIQMRRLRRLRILLGRARETRSVAELAFACGFISESHASRSFRSLFGTPPGEFRKHQLISGTNPMPAETGREDWIRSWVAPLTFGASLERP